MGHEKNDWIHRETAVVNLRKARYKPINKKNEYFFWLYSIDYKPLFHWYF